MVCNKAEHARLLVLHMLHSLMKIRIIFKLKELFLSWQGAAPLTQALNESISVSIQKQQPQYY